MRIGFSRAYSSATSALRPATLPTINTSFAERRRKADVVKHRCQCAVHVDGERLDLFLARRLQSRHEGDPVPGHPAIPGHPEQNIGSGIMTVNPVPQARQSRVAGSCFVDEKPRGALNRNRFFPCACDSPGDHLHTGRTRPAVLIAYSQDPSGNGGGQGLPVAGRHQARGGAGRSSRSMIGHSDQDCVQKPALGRVRQATAMQQEQHIGEGRLFHQRRDVIAADPNSVLVGRADFGSPRLDHNCAHYQSERRVSRRKYWDLR